MTITAKALVLREINGPLTFETIHLNDLRPNEVLVEIHATGLCHTDLSCMTGQLPTVTPCVFGHEGAGLILKTGTNITHLQINDKVLLSYEFCGTCTQCTSDHPAYCHEFVKRNFGQQRPDGSVTLATETGERLHGNFFGQSSFSSYAIVNASCIVKVGPETPLNLFAPLGCGFQTGAGAVFNTLDMESGASFAVFGAGSVGMSAIMAAKIRGAKVIIAIDLHQERLDIAKKVGATHAILGSDENVIEQIQKICQSHDNNNGVQYAVDCTGVTQVIEKALDSLGPRGKLATVGAPSPGKKVSVEVFSHLAFGRQYVGCCEGDSVAQKFLPFLVEQHSQGKYPIEEIITYYPIEEYNKAISDTKEGKTLKAVLLWKY